MTAENQQADLASGLKQVLRYLPAPVGIVSSYDTENGQPIGLAMSGLVMRVGQSAESFAWAAVFILMPVSGVYYPISVLPHWLQPIAWGVPTSYVFEGMRSILAEGTVHWDLMAFAFGLSIVYLIVGFQVFQWFFRSSRRAGSLLGQGE